MVYVFFAEGYEEVEALTVVDYLRRGDVDVKMVSITDDIMVRGCHGVNIEVDLLLKDADFDACEMIVLPGGLPGADYLGENKLLLKKIAEFAESEDKRIAAICAAPEVFAKAGVLDGKNATAYPTKEYALGNVTYLTDKVVTDGNITTSRGPSTAVDFALELLELLAGRAVRETIQADILL